MNSPIPNKQTSAGPRGPIMMKWIALVITCLGLCQCTQVKLWQRGKLADYTMRPDRDALALTLSDHVFFSREAASGGRGIGGGGCGCN